MNNPFLNKNRKFILEIENSLSEQYKEIDRITELNDYKVIKSMQENQLSQADFAWTTGYGYGDYGREKVEKIYSDIFHTEDALVRPSIASGTHALYIIMSAILKSGDELLSVSGKLYDTIQKVIGLTGSEKGSLISKGIKYNEVDLKNNTFDYENIKKAISNDTKLITIQRSIGYAHRKCHSIEEIEKLVKFIRSFNKEVIIMCDNCYGEFTRELEPSDVGVDIVGGSLIKNLGAGISIGGGYICGKKDLIEMCANRLTAPGLGKDLGLTFGTSRLTLQGLFYAPMVVANALKSALIVGKTFENLGFEVFPKSDSKRNDIVQAIILENEDNVIKFCREIQKAGTVNSHVTPYPWDMPGYEDQVIMASSGFIDGSSIELSADAPLRQPYIVFYQGEYHITK